MQKRLGTNQEKNRRNVYEDLIRNYRGWKKTGTAKRKDMFRVPNLRKPDETYSVWRNMQENQAKLHVLDDNSRKPPEICVPAKLLKHKFVVRTWTK